MKFSFKLILILLITKSVLAQSGSEIYKQLKKVNTLSSVLYVAAHPDDENTSLISLFSNHYSARTGYLSMTRGDGGQNLIGTELRESLGLIRTQELLEARKLDGGQQFFTTANDFGYSKHPDETLSIWNKQSILSEIVYRIRAFKPDIIIHRFDHRTPGSSHGHHTSSALLSEEAFHLANNPKAFPEQLKHVSLWQPKRQFYNTSWWSYGSKQNFEKADKSNMIILNSNPIDYVLGRFNSEVAAKSRSQHKSQGFGSAPVLGIKNEYLELINGIKLDSNNPFDGIETEWSKIDEGSNIGLLIEKIIQDYDLEKPYKSTHQLLDVYKKIKALKNKHWREIKSKELELLIMNSLGLRIQFNTNQPTGVKKTIIETKLELVNPSPLKVSIIKIDGDVSLNENQIINQNILWHKIKNIVLPEKITTPYWLLENGDIGNYKVSDEKLKGLPETPNPIIANFTLNIEGSIITFPIPLTYRSSDRVSGEVVENFQLLPKIITKLNESVIIFNHDLPKQVRIQVQSNAQNTNGLVKLLTPENWKVIPDSQKFNIIQAGGSKEFVFEVTPPEKDTTAIFSSLVIHRENSYTMKLETIKYPHISKQYLVSPNSSKAVKIDLKSSVKQIAYLKGAGDKVAESLRNIGIQVTEFTIDELRLSNLLPFPTLVVGIRAFNVHQDLSFKNEILWKYVAQGGTVIVQYNTSRGLDGSIVGPYPISFSKDRVTNEFSKVTFLQPDHRILNFPNKITQDDFNGWVQERGLYFSNNWDKNYKAILSMNDVGESSKKGSLLLADYGKGKFIFTGLSFFRELPEGVPGAYRLFANLISYGQ